MGTYIDRTDTLPDSSNKTDFYTLIDTARPICMADDDADTKIQVEESADEDVVRIDAGGVEVATFSATASAINRPLTINDDGSNGICATIDNDGTNHGLYITADGVLASGKHGLYIYTNAQQGDYLVHFKSDNSSSTTGVLAINNDGTGYGCTILQNTALAANMHALYIYSSAEQDTSELVLVHQDNAASDYHAFKAQNDSSSATAYAIGAYVNGCIGVYVNNGGAVDSILDDSGAKLTAAGTWTDAPCCHANKVDVAEARVDGYTDKLKNLKLFNYKTKIAVEKNFKYQRQYTGYILDDPSTPDELVSRDHKGEINGVSPADGVNFLLAVCKELLTRVEALEAV